MLERARLAIMRTPARDGVMRHLAVLVIGLAAALSGPLHAAQQAPSRQQPVFRASTELVEVDVVVVDNAGHPVHGLASGGGHHAQRDVAITTR